MYKLSKFKLILIILGLLQRYILLYYKLLFVQLRLNKTRYYVVVDTDRK